MYNKMINSIRYTVTFNQKQQERMNAGAWTAKAAGEAEQRPR